jgi:serine/threonine protein kinase
MPTYFWSQIREIAQGLAFLHDQRVVHGDLRGVSSTHSLKKPGAEPPIPVKYFGRRHR